MAILSAPSPTRVTTAEPTSCRIDRDDAAIRVIFDGAWILGAASRFDSMLQGLGAEASKPVIFDLAHVTRLDTSGAWILSRTARQLAMRSIDVSWRNLPEVSRPLLDLVAGECNHPVLSSPNRHTLTHFLERVGRGVVGFLLTGLALLNFFGRITVDSWDVIKNPRRLRLAAVLVQLEDTGLNALPILGLLSFLIGVVLAYQGAEQFHRYGADIYTVNLISVTVLREMGVMITAIIVAGRSGSAFTAQIGVMQVDEEIDAIETMGLSLVEVLILPRLIGLMIAVPLLTFFANVMGVLGGAVICYFVLGISLSSFLNQLQISMYGWSFWLGLMKAPVFAFLIATVGCLDGLSVERNAASVGRLTTRSVVESLFLVILADALFSILFQKLGI